MSPESGGGENSSSNLTVAVRVRPLSLKEKARQSWATVEVLDATHVLVRDISRCLRTPSAEERRGSASPTLHRFLPD